MDIRKIAAAAALATGSALALAPLASADLTTTVTSTLDSEIALQNSIFELQAASAGAEVTKATAPGQYDSLTNLSHDAPHLIANTASYGQVTPLETEIYGANPILAGISSETGPYNELNGALTQLYDAYNVYAFAAANGGTLDANPADYLGSATTIGHALDTGSVSGASQYFLTFAEGDLKGFDAIFAPNATGIGDILPTQANEIVQLNNLFELDGKLANVFADIVPHTAVGTNVGFDTIPVGDLNTTFNDLVFGAAGPSTDPGSYDVLNGALTEFFNADNVGLYALLNGGDLLPSDLVFGTHDFTGSVATVIGDYLNLGFQDLLGYF
ncbi:hypothetical protein [Mycobacterium cookii]|uniref:hypothetical protein n=1 Tax=Mycobacterium cookii TaxID=1775 RepID=UPI0013D8D74A|nr:hypothetical protein [Mycobacterium cookii]MCV7332528.1 hypothetical protein [Mycobacterium cookii]